MPKAAPPQLKAAKHKGGRPSKKTPATLEAALSAAREGLPLRFCAGLAGITYQSLNEYRKTDSGFCQRLETAMSEGVLSKWRKIVAAGDRETPASWQSLAWTLERSFCSEFSRPEIQLHALTQINNTTTNNSLVVSMEVGEKLQARSKAIEAEIDKGTEAFLSRRSLTNGRDPVREIEAELANL